jgi:hypothetical protein
LHRSKNMPLVVCECSTPPWPLFTMLPHRWQYTIGPLVGSTQWDGVTKCDWTTISEERVTTPLIAEDGQTFTLNENVSTEQVSGKCNKCGTRFALQMTGDMKALLNNIIDGSEAFAYDFLDGWDPRDQILHALTMGGDWKPITIVAGNIRLTNPDERPFILDVKIPSPNGLMQRLHVTDKSPFRLLFCRTCDEMQTLMYHRLEQPEVSDILQLQINGENERIDVLYRAYDEAKGRVATLHPKVCLDYPDWSPDGTEEQFAGWFRELFKTMQRLRKED